MNFLDFIPSAIFEVIGTLAGLSACGVILVQLIKEWRDSKPSTLSFTYVIGWIFIFLFWFLYGIRFRTMALWLTNFIAVALQIGMFIVIFRKRLKN